MKNIILPKFQEYLRSKSLIDEKYISYYALWARIFLAFSKSNGNLSHDVQVQKFIDYLKSQKGIADWQVKEADNAIQLYVNQFLGSVESTSPPIQPEKKERSSAISNIIGDMRQVLRIKQYAYSTELSYIEWVEKFYEYTVNVN